MPYNPFSTKSADKHMGKNPLDNIANDATKKYRANKIKQRQALNGSSKKYVGNGNTATSIAKKKKKKFSFLGGLK